MQSTPLISSSGKLIGMISTHFVLPWNPGERELRAMDLLARNAADYLERLQLDEEQRRLNAELQRADMRKNEFLATLAHELRNPLAPMLNAVEILKAPGLTQAQLAWTRDVIGRQVAKMARLLDDLLEVGRVTSDKLLLRRRPVGLRSVLDSAIETSRPMLDAARHELRVAVPDDEICLDADPVRLAQVFSNLLNNAAKYTPEGGHVLVRAERQAHEVVVSVEDDGIGFAPEMAPRLFDMFAQATPALERAQGGLGIGLSLVKAIAELHGGSVSAHSDGPGKGSVFTVRLSVDGAELAAILEAVPGMQERGSVGD